MSKEFAKQYIESKLNEKAAFFKKGVRRGLLKTNAQWEYLSGYRYALIEAFELERDYEFNLKTQAILTEFLDECFEIENELTKLENEQVKNFVRAIIKQLRIKKKKIHKAEWCKSHSVILRKGGNYNDNNKRNVDKAKY